MWWWIEEPGFSTFQGLNMTTLNVDEAWLNVTTGVGSPPQLWLYGVSANCHYCPFQRQSKDPLIPTVPQSFRIKSQYPSRYRLRRDGSVPWITHDINDIESFCETHLSPGEFGVYTLSTNNSTGGCVITTNLQPVNTYLPLLICFIFYTALLLGSIFFKKFKKFGFCTQSTTSDPTSEAPQPGSSCTPREQENVGNRPRKKGKKRQKPVDNSQKTILQTSSESSLSVSLMTPQEIPQPPPPQRFRSIDAFRGLCILIMIFVDDGGGQYYFFEHSTWDGLYVADLAFPWFLWIMGTCIPISIQAQKNRLIPNRTVLQRIFIRSLKLFFLGILVNTTSKCDPVNISQLRIPGVLQRFGVLYFFASVLFLTCSSNHSNDTEIENVPFFKKLRKHVPWIIVLSCIVLHTSLIFLLPVPGCPTGYLGPGGLHLNNKYPPHCIGGATGYIDRLLFTTDHIYRWPTPKKVYKSGPFDPEGAFGLFPSLLQVWLGVETGKIFTRALPPSQKLLRTLFFSLLSATAGLLLSGGLRNEGWIPINKNLWSLSYVLVTSALAWLVLSCFYFIIDVQGFWSGCLLLEPGSNSMLLYVGHEVAHSMLPWHFSWGRMNTHWAHLLENLWGTSLWVGVSLYLHRKRVFWVV